MTMKFDPSDLDGVAGMLVGLDGPSIARDYLFNLFCRQAKFAEVATKNDQYMALAYTVRDRMLHRWIHTAHAYFERESRTVAYLSAEYLIGPQLASNLLSLGIYDETEKALSQLGVKLEDLIEHEEEPGLGNGGLGRLAACYMDSLATLQIPAIGYGIRYEFGIFDQQIRDGQQVEATDSWLRYGYPWEVPRPEIELVVKLGGHTEGHVNEQGRYVVTWVPGRIVKGVPYDTPVLGFGVENANFLRLWQAVAAEALDLSAFNAGDYFRAVQQKVVSENITKILYPNDQPEVGKILRLEQQYFFVSCSLQDMIRIHLQREKNLDRFHEKYAIQLNDTHPALSVAELMRLFVDEHGMEWNKAWSITTQTFGYTNHTLLPEALETWSLPLFRRVLPRHLEIILEINRRFLDTVRARFPGDEARLGRMSLIDEHVPKSVRMANLACVGSHAINGVAALHTDLLKQTVLADFADLYPERFSNKTNGVTQRRFLLLANPRLSALLKEVIGDGWTRDLTELSKLEKFATDASFIERFRAARRLNKVELARRMSELCGVDADVDGIFDIQVKRIHEYKRQHLNVLHTIALYQRIKEGRAKGMVPRTVIFGGKAAPGYAMARLMIRLIHDVADVVNHDLQVSKLLKIAFVPDFNVKNAQRIYPAADLSEQISTAGKEASGTGNMKFAMNGALTIGTLDGANVEIREEVGADNFFLFGLTVDEVQATRRNGYSPRQVYENESALRGALDLLMSGAFSHGERDRYVAITAPLLERDDYMLCADFQSYLDAQDRVAATYADPATWWRMATLNVARAGKFSSDRAVREYCEEIWRVKPVSVDREP